MLRLPCALAIVLSGSVALADEATRKLEARARAAMGEGDFAEALALNRAIWQRDETSSFAACNIGTLSYGMHDFREAVEWLTLCLRLEKPPRTPLERQRHALRVKDLALAKQWIATIIVRTNRPNAEVFVAGRRAQIGVPALVNPGKVSVWAQDDGRVKRADVEAHAGDEHTVLLEFADSPPPAPVAAVSPAPAPIRPVPVPVPSSGVSTNLVYPVTIITGASLTALFLVVGASAHINAQKANTDAESADERCRDGAPRGCDDRDAAKAAHRGLLGLEIASFTLAGTLAVATVVYAVKARPNSPLVPGGIRW